MQKTSKVLIINQTPVNFFIKVLSEIKKSADLTVFCGQYDQYFPNDITYVKSIKYNRNSSIKRIFTWLIFSIHLTFYLIKNSFKYEKILVVSNPPFAIWASLFSKSKYSILLYDIYPNVLFKFNNKSNNKFIFVLKIGSFFWKIINYMVYRNAENIFTISNAMANEINYSTIFPENIVNKIKVIYPWSSIKPSKNKAKVSDLRKKLIENKPLLIIYAGNMGITHPLEYLVESSKSISKYAKIVLIGNGSRKSFLKKISLKFHKNKPIFLDPVPFDEISNFIEAADLSIVSIDYQSSNISLPSKLFSSLNCSQAILAIAPLDSELSRIILNFKCGFVIPPDSSFEKNIKILLEDLIVNPKKLKIAKSNAKIASKNFSEDNAKKLSYLFKKN
tara:strand:- start:524 stop:1693 length:1170 start_codon:yes stop_codon:yes gene_type:complete